MFLSLQEFESPRMDQALGSGCPLMAPPFCEPVLKNLDYLFVGTPERIPALVVAGGVLADGTPVSGVGRDRDAALKRLAGETAEQLALRGIFPKAPKNAKPVYFDHISLGAEGDETFLAASDWSGREVLAVPSVLLPASPEQTDGYSEGMAAHPDLKAARLHAALELVERDAVTLWWAGAHKAISLAGAQAYAIARLGPRLGRSTLLLDVTCDTLLPVVVAVSFDEGGCEFCFGASAALTLEQAANGALRELGAAEFGLALEQSRAKDFEDLPGESRWATVVHRTVFEAGLVGEKVDLEERSAHHRMSTGTNWFSLLATLGVCFVELGCVGKDFHAVKALSAKLQSGQEKYHTERFVGATQGCDRVYEGPLY